MSKHIKDEVRDFKSRFFGKNVATIFTNHKYKEYDEEEFYCLVKNIEGYDRPDAYSIVNNTVILIDFFKIDASVNNKKGSRNLKERSIAINDVDSLYEEVKKLGGIPDEVNEVISHTYYEQTGSLEGYISSFKKAFINHYQKLDDYKTHFLNDYPEYKKYTFKYCFILDDLTVDPIYRYNNKELPFVPLLCSNEFLSFYALYTKVDYVILLKDTRNGPVMQVVGNKHIDYDLGRSLLDGELIINKGVEIYSLRNK